MRCTLIAACALFATLATAAPIKPDGSIGMKTDGIIIRKSTGFQPHRITLDARRHEDGVAGDEEEGGDDGQEVEEDEEKNRAASRGGSQAHGTFFQPVIQTTANPTINTVGQTGDGVIFGQRGSRVSEGVVGPEEA
ncbi:hypothetical protein BJV82DRAFT_609769 [Fennellomyces sp. T-0311]|nr:hypothetical protein BJV82DRAFT_609769 [Fennellomyces sp. T-0311]